MTSAGVRIRNGDCDSVLGQEADKLADRAQQHESSSYGQSKWTLSASETSVGTLSVLTRTRSRRTQQLSQLDQPGTQNRTQAEEEEVTTSVSLVLGRSHAIRVHIRQTYSDDGIFSGIPHLSVHNVLPMDSPVFEIVRQGRLREFQVLLQEGKASLRDQDEYGASLLHVSVLLPIKAPSPPSSSFPHQQTIDKNITSLPIPHSVVTKSLYSSMRTGNLRCADISFNLVQTWTMLLG